MRAALFALFLASCLLARPVLAEEATGKVRGLYYESSRGVLVDASMLRSSSAKRWVDVELVGEHAPQRQLVELPAGMNAAIGDMVTLRLGEPKSTQLAAILPALAAHRALAVNPQGPSFAATAPLGSASLK